MLYWLGSAKKPFLLAVPQPLLLSWWWQPSALLTSLHFAETLFFQFSFLTFTQVCNLCFMFIGFLYILTFNKENNQKKENSARLPVSFLCNPKKYVLSHLCMSVRVNFGLRTIFGQFFGKTCQLFVYVHQLFVYLLKNPSFSSPILNLEKYFWTQKLEF